MRPADEGLIEAGEPAWTAYPAQNHYISCPVYEVGWLGEKGGGKSDGLLMEPIVNQYMPARTRFEETGKKSYGWVIFIRKEYSRLREVIMRAKELFPKLDPESLKRPGYGWVSQERTYRFTCGFQYEFGHLEDPDSHEIYTGRQFSRVIVDEAPEIPFHQYQFLKSCIRVRKGVEPYLDATQGVRIAGNPYGPHVEWVKKRFVEAAPPNTIISETLKLPDGQEVVRQRVFIPARLKDNPTVDYAQYAATLADLPEHMKRAFLYGDWSYVQGSYFAGAWDPQIHVCEPFGVPDHWEIIRGGDWGASHTPACCLWATCDNDGNLIVMDELYGPGITGGDWAARGLAREEERGWRDTSGWLDPGAWAAHGSAAPSPGDDLLTAGWLWYPSDKSKGSVVLAAIDLTRRLRMRTKSGVPGILIFNRCKHLIKQIAQVRSDPDKPDELAPMREDHAWEALRALLLAKPTATVAPKPDEELRRWERLNRAQKNLDRQRIGWY